MGVAQAAVRAAQPFLEDALRVREALDARDGSAQGRARHTPAALWQRAGGDEGPYLELMRQHGWLKLTRVCAGHEPNTGRIVVASAGAAHGTALNELPAPRRGSDP
jgi:hypothetical protein